jgi:tetratricopeptide (TPR) repeat protein
MRVAAGNDVTMIFQRISLALAICLALVVPVASQSVTPEEAGVLALQAGDFDKAASIFADALRRSPRDPGLHMGAGVAAHFLGRDDEARTFLNRALELEPRFTAASGLLGQIAYDQGDVDLAIHIYEQALKYAPTSVPIRNALKAWRDDAAKERRVDGPFSIAFEGPAEARLATHASAVLEAAYWRIGKALGAYPSQPVEVIFYTLKQFRDVTGAPEWAAGTFDTRIRIPVQGALANPGTFDRVLTHELAHAMIAGVARRGVPAWLHEGLAQYFEPADVSLAEQRWKVFRTVIPLELLQDGFAQFDSREARIAYDQSLVAASVLMAHLGPNMALLLHDLDSGNDFSLALTRVGFADADFEGELTRRLK